ncbi:transposase, partial [Nocardia gipuzkoensis]|uniref:transposase n=1 Tax=Nocardia gipuzkoensis TaxID=2749991 RepID=UPI003B8A608C
MPAHHNATSKQTNTDRKADQAQHLAGSVVLLEGCPHASSQARLFTVEYKVEAAHRVIDSGRASTEVARELGVHETALSHFRWYGYPIRIRCRSNRNPARPYICLLR